MTRGFTGIIQFVDYCRRNSIKIGLDSNKSFACQIYSNDSIMNGKPAILLYDLNITGKGLHPSYIREIKLILKKGDEWIHGKQFKPSQRDRTDRGGGVDLL